jgi:hypothetical protein
MSWAALSARELPVPKMGEYLEISHRSSMSVEHHMKLTDKPSIGASTYCSLGKLGKVGIALLWIVDSTSTNTSEGEFAGLCELRLGSSLSPSPARSTGYYTCPARLSSVLTTYL